MSDAGPDLPPPIAAIFDLDGTLIDSAHDLADAVNEVLAERRLPTHGVDEIRRWIGEGAERLMERALAGGQDRPMPADETTHAVARFRAIYATRSTRHTVLYPDALEVLDRCAAARIPLAILTNKPTNQTAPILHHFGLDRRVVAWLGGDSPFGRKPDPRPLLALLDRMGVGNDPASRAATWMVGDSITDIRVAHAAGARSIAVRGGYDDADPLDRCQPRPDRLIGSLNDLLRWLP